MQVQAQTAVCVPQAILKGSHQVSPLPRQLQTRYQLPALSSRTQPEARALSEAESDLQAGPDTWLGRGASWIPGLGEPRAAEGSLEEETQAPCCTARDSPASDCSILTTTPGRAAHSRACGQQEAALGLKAKVGPWASLHLGQGQ